MAVEAAAIQVTLPAMGESVTEGTILEWHKQVGDTIEADEILVEVSTDKVDAEVPAPASGTIVAIHFAEGDTVQVGSVLAEIAAGAETGPAHPGSPNGDSGNGSGATAEAGVGGSDSTPGEIIDITTPAGGESVTEGTILEWAVKVGDTVEDGDTVVEISTDKVDMELPAPAAGTITELLAEEGATVVVGQVIARMQLGAGAP
ncbi:MAG: biotin/lipoyl-containing protein, partial [Baekduia sp.]